MALKAFIGRVEWVTPLLLRVDGRGNVGARSGKRDGV